MILFFKGSARKENTYTADKWKRNKNQKRKQKNEYLFFNKLTLELVGVLEALTIDLDSGAAFLSDITQVPFLQFNDLWDLVFAISITKSENEHGQLTPGN